MTLTANWSYPTTVKFGSGRIRELGEACLSLGVKNPLLGTDKGLAQLDITQKALAILKSSGFESSVFFDVDPNPNETNLEAALVVYNDGNHDAVIAFGGSSDPGIMNNPTPTGSTEKMLALYNSLLQHPLPPIIPEALIVASASPCLSRHSLTAYTA